MSKSLLKSTKELCILLVKQSDNYSTADLKLALKNEVLGVQALMLT